MKNNLFQDFIHRMLSKNPLFFQIIQYLSVALFVCSWVISAFVEEGVNLPNWINAFDGITTKLLTAITAILAQLPNAKDTTENK